jgi:uncharacterized membrane protein
LSGEVRQRPNLFDRLTEETGIAVGLTGLGFALAGVSMGFLGLPTIGYWVAAFGMMLVFVGMALHFIKNWRSIFRLDQDDRPEE